MLERSLLWFVRVGFLLLLLAPFVVSKTLFFPFITGKNFYFRIITELTFGAWVALACLNPSFRPKKSPLLFALLAFVVVLSLATILGADPYHSFWSNFERMEGLVTHLHLFALFLALAHSVKGQKEWAMFLIISLGVSFVEAIHGFLQSTGTLEVVGGGRVFAGFGNSIYLSVYLMFHFFFAAILFLRSKTPWIRGLAALLFAVELYVFFQSASRGAFIGFSTGVALAAVLFIIFSKSRMYRVVGLVGVSLIVVLAALILFAPQSVLIQKSELLSRLSGVSFKSVSNDPRVMIWGIALEAAKARPILGWGPENFVIPYAQFYNPNLFGNEPWFDRAHNMFLEWLVAAGIIGLVAYLSIFASVGFIAYKLMRRNLLSQSESIVIISLFIAYMVQNIFVFDNIITYIVLISLFAYLHASYALHNVREPSKRKEQPIALIGSAAAVVASIAVSYMLNARPIYVARHIIVGLESLRGANGDKIIQEFKRAIEPRTFGTTEARERIADSVVQVAVNVGQTNVEFEKLLNFSIDEFGRELASSPSPRIPLFLGKLYTISANLGRTENIVKAEMTYKELQGRAPNYVQTYLGLAELYLITGRSKEATIIADRAFQLPTSENTRAALFFPILSVKILSGEFHDATRFLEDYDKQYGTWPLLVGYTDDSNIKLLVERALVDRGDQKERLLFFQRLASKVDHPMVYLGLAQSYGRLGQITEARAFVLKALAWDPSLKSRIDSELIQAIGNLP